MASDLYETLNIARDATAEQIRKAYRKLALQTHPDRLPPNATASDKAASEEKFRKVNNAYEVLSDEPKRKLYDQHGVWPPPEQQHEQFPHRSGPSHHSSFNHHYHHRPFPDPFGDPFFARPTFVFTDPFMLFESIFGDIHRMHNPAHQYEPRAHEYDPYNSFERVGRMHAEFANMITGMERDMFSPLGIGFPSRSFTNTSSGNGSMRWASESHMVSSVHGVTQSITQRRDWDGNEHVTRTFPDGREVHTVNGVEQPSGLPQALPYNSSPLPITNSHSLPYRDHTGSRVHSPPPVGHAHSTGSGHYSSAPPPYSGSPNDYIRNEYSGSSHSRRHGRQHSNSHPVVSDPYNPHSGAPVTSPSAYNRPHDSDAKRHKRRWWPGGR